MEINKHNVELEISVGHIKQVPSNKLKHIVLLGKSNVGKSSLINALINRRNFARTSSTPGKTRTINFYNVDKKFYFVDLPGYGFANISKEKKEAFSTLIEEYLNRIPNPKKLVMLIDIRHEPSKNDMVMYEYMKQIGESILIVATKADKISKNEKIKNLNLLIKTLKIDQKDEIIPFSSVTKDGVDLVWKRIEEEIHNENH